MSRGKLAGTSAITAIAASLCCITPVLALVAGTGSMASSFSWIAFARPFLIGLTIVVLGFAWYQKLRPQATDDCGCAVDEKAKFLQSKIFLLIVTIFAGLMMAFPSYARVFFPKIEKAVIVTEKSNFQTVELSIKGMSCKACESEVNHKVNKLSGIIQSRVSYERKNALIQFDSSKVTVFKIINAVHVTGYKVINHSFKN